MNVRCPNCKAVFPANPQAGSQETVECPLCLLRFQASGEDTTSLPQAPAPGLIQPLDDEFESFGAPVQFNTTRVVGSEGRAPAPVKSTEPTQTAPKRPAAEVAEIGFAAPDTSDGIDFNALLADAVGSPASRLPGNDALTRANPFSRISNPRSGVGGVDEAVPIPSLKTLSPSSVSSSFAAPSPTASAEDFDAMFDLSATAPSPDALDEFSVPVLSASDPLDVAHVARPAIGRPRPPKRQKRSSRPVRAILVGLALFVAGLGVAAQFMGYGWFASKLWLTHDDAVIHARTRARANAMMHAVVLLDTRATYVEEIKRLDKVLGIWKSDSEAHAALLDRYLDLLERDPAFFLADNTLNAGLEAELARGKSPPRVEVLRKLAAGDVLAVEAQLPELLNGSLDDVGVFVRLRLALLDHRLRTKALANPGMTSSPQSDPLQAPAGDDAGLLEARKVLNERRTAASRVQNTMKFKVLDAALAERMGDADAAIALLEPVTSTVADHTDARLILASAYVAKNLLDQADTLAAEALHIATDVAIDKARQREAWLVTARIEAKRGRTDGVIKALQGGISADPKDELSTLRLGRLLMADKRGDEAHKLFASGKSRGFKSIAFEVSLVEHWLYINRSEDALAEIVEATKMYPESVELLFLRGQVEDKQSHFATARDFFAQVIAREPRHQRAIIRLAELQSAAGRHDEALATLLAARAKVGDEEEILIRISAEYTAMQRDEEARGILDLLLKMAPDNRAYLLSAAQMDLRAGKTERALGFLQRLRREHALTRDAAVQLAKALARKGQADDAAATLMPFAEQEQSNVALNTQVGAYLIDSKDYDRAATVLDRATTVANGRDAEAMFQFGRLAFRRGDPTKGTQRIRQAIGLDPSEPAFRLELAQSLVQVKTLPDARKMAVTEIETLLANEAAYAKAGRSLPDTSVVHALLAHVLIEDSRYANAIEHLRAVIQRHPSDGDALIQLGRCLYYAGSPEAPKILRDGLRQRPGDGLAALYLGLSALNHNQSSEAMRWLQMAAQNHHKDTAQAWYHLALIHKDREQYGSAVSALESYFADSDPADPYRRDAKSLQSAISNRK